MSKMRHWMNMTFSEGITVQAYHGTTNAEFAAFDLAKAGSANKTWKDQAEIGAIWAAQNPQVASAFAGSDVHGNSPEGAAVMPVKLHMDNPLVVDMEKEAPRLGSDAYFNHRTGRLWDINPLKEYFLSLARDHGHDGVIFQNGYDGWMARGDLYAVFSPTQVKMMQQESIRHWMRLVEANVPQQGVWWHGSASGDLRGGRSGLHVGTKQAATDALEARIGIPADGQGWTGDREYGKTLLAGKATMKRLGHYPTGFNCDAPEDDYYPSKSLKYPDGSLMPMTVRPAVRPYRIIGPMTNGTHTPYEDFKANGIMAAQIKRYGRGKRGYYYTNVGEDAGSISAVVPDGSHLEAL